jgi:hypothetical protein
VLDEAPLPDRIAPVNDPITITLTPSGLVILFAAYLLGSIVGILYRAFWRAFWPKVRNEYRWRKRARKVHMSGNESGRHQ